MIKAADRRKSRGPPTHGVRRSKDRDDDLLLFKDLIKQDKERTLSLLQPVSEEFEPHPIVVDSSRDVDAGNNHLYRIPSRKGVSGNELLSAGGDKNDYDWLKTPPATPLFPSLEMEAGAGAGGAQWMVQREIPLLQPIRTSRFSTRPAEGKPAHVSGADQRPSVPTRSRTPGPRLPGSITTKPVHASDGQKIKPVLIPAVTRIISEPKTKPVTPLKLFARTANDPKSKPRGSSPVVRSRMPATLPGFTSEAPPNLRTSSATRGRPGSQGAADTAKGRRQSCSPSTTRGRKPEAKREAGVVHGIGHGPSLVVGSKMVEKVVNARKASRGDGEKDSGRYRVSGSDGAGYGRDISRAALDTTLKHMDINRGGYSTNIRHYNALISRKPALLTRNHHFTSAALDCSSANNEDETSDDQMEVTI